MQVFEGMPFKFSVEVECTVSLSGLCRSMFVCLCVCVCVCLCVCNACHSILITSSHTCFPRRLSLPSSHASSSKPDPATVVASLSLHAFPSSLSGWSGPHSTAITPLVLLCCPGSVRPCWYHTIPGWKIHAALGSTIKD